MVLANNEAVESFLSGKLSRVDINGILGELKDLWKQAGESDSGAGDSGESESAKRGSIEKRAGKTMTQVIRACSLNLVLFSDSEDAEISAANMLDEVITENPARAILAITRAGTDNRLEAWVSARCHLAAPGSAKQICSEQITLVADAPDGPNSQQIASIIDSLLIGDLPVVLWWTLPNLTGDSIGNYLARVQRLIVDSLQASLHSDYLRNLQQLVQSAGPGFAVCDLNWHRLLAIRTAIAQEFERSPLSIDDLQRIDSIVINTAAQPCTIQALMLTCWLASRLGWEPLSFDLPTKAIFLAGDRQICIGFSDTDANCNESYLAEAGNILSVEFSLTSSLSKEEIAGGTRIGEKKVIVERIGSNPSAPTNIGRQILTTVLINGQIDREFRISDSLSKQSSMVGRILQEDGHDTVFSEAINMTERLLETCK